MEDIYYFYLKNCSFSLVVFKVIADKNSKMPTTGCEKYGCSIKSARRPLNLNCLFCSWEQANSKKSFPDGSSIEIKIVSFVLNKGGRVPKNIT